MALIIGFINGKRQAEKVVPNVKVVGLSKAKEKAALMEIATKHISKEHIVYVMQSEFGEIK